MAKTPGQRGDFGRWLEAARTARYDTQKKALTEMDRLAGLRIAPSEYAQWESGSRVPRADNPKVERLYEFFGSRPQPESETADPSLAVAISELVAELREGRLERGRLDERVAALEAVVARLAERALEAPSGLPAPRVSTGSVR